MSTDEIQIPEACDGDTRYLAGEMEEGNPKRQAIIDASEAGRLMTDTYQKVKAVPGHNRQTNEGFTWVQSHFSPIGTRIKMEAIATLPPERDPTHNKTVALLRDTLNFYGSNVVIATNDRARVEKVPDGKGGTKPVMKPLKLWSCPDGSEYVWQREPWTHHWFENNKYIQPNLVGFDAKRPCPGPSNPPVIIEVINFHPPEFGTWARLVELSKSNHLVLFYLCSEKLQWGKFGKMKKRIKKTKREPINRLWIQVAFYLRDGIFYDEGEAKTWLVKSEEDMKKQHDRVDKIFKRMRATYF